MKKLLLLLLVITFSSLVIVGCSKGKEEEEKVLEVGVTVADLANPFFSQIIKGAKIKGEELTGGSVKVTGVSSNYDLGVQSQQIDNFISSGVDIILINAVDTKGIGPAIKRAVDVGIVVVAVDVASDNALATVASDNVMAGMQACQYIADKLNGVGKVIIINGPPVSSVFKRVDGCKQVFSKYPGINILSDNQNAGGARDQGLQVMSSLLSAFPEVDAVFAINDPEAIGAELASRQAGRTEMFFTSVDGSPDAEISLKEEGSRFEATAAQDPQTMASTAMELAWKIYNGETDYKEINYIDTTLITRDNIDSYVGWTQK